MKPNRLIRLVSLLVLASVALTAQVARQDNAVPLKNWATPLYWQPNQTERGPPPDPAPQLQFSVERGVHATLSPSWRSRPAAWWILEARRRI